MTLALVHGRACAGIDAPAVQVEVFLAGGLPRLQIVGLPATAVRESRDRVRAAIQCAQQEFPQRAVTINLAPADLPKDGARFDLPIAIGILAASAQVPLPSLRGIEFTGELGLTGELRAVDGALPAALAAGRAGHVLVVPAANAREASLARGVDVRVARTLMEVLAHLRGERTLPRADADAGAAAAEGGDAPSAMPDLRDVRGQSQARRALEVAAAGGHHLVLIGPPGCGKTLLAARLPGLLPALDDDAALEVAAIASAAGRGIDPARWRTRPFRAPHHGASAVALAGGGPRARPGEISLAHHGVLFLDELPEWQRHALDMLREPMESGAITIARAARQCAFPARFQLVAAMNPCPCGWAGDASGRCRCPEEAIRRYRARVSGPLLDRIDLHVELARLPPSALRPDAPVGEASDVVRTRVEAALARQRARAGVPNAWLDHAATLAHCRLAAAEQRTLERAIDALRLSARSMHRILRMARTIADLDGSDGITAPHLAEALGYRRLDRDSAAEPGALTATPVVAAAATGG